MSATDRSAVSAADINRLQPAVSCGGAAPLGSSSWPVAMSTHLSTAYRPGCDTEIRNESALSSPVRWASPLNRGEHRSVCFEYREFTMSRWRRVHDVPVVVVLKV